MGISVKITVSEQINFAISGIKKNIVKSVQVDGCKGKTAILRIYGTPNFFHEYKREFTPNADVYRNNRTQLQINDEYFRQNVLEGKDATINVEILDNEQPDKILASTQETVHLQPYLHWDRAEDPVSLASFMQPSEPLVAKVLGRAGELANANGGMMVSYQQALNTSPFLQAKWIYEALAEEKIHYYYPPAGFECCGQKIRIPGMALNEKCKQGTCLDLAVLYASCLEAASLNSVVFVVDGHAFAGLWLDENASFDDFVCTDIGEIKNKLAINIDSVNGGVENKSCSLIPIECTVFADDRGVAFNDAILYGVNALRERQLRFAIDVRLSRAKGYIPVFSYTGNPICDPEIINPLMKPANSIISKIERFQNQAMDISLSNNLLNLNDTKEALVFDVDAMSVLAGEICAEDLVLALKQSMSKLPGGEDEAEKRLYYLMKADAETEKKNGVNSAFFAVNILNWIPTNGTDPVSAPLFVCPVELYRNVCGEIVFRITGEFFVNPALKQVLFSEYNLDISAVSDIVNYEEQVAFISHIIHAKNGWELVTDKACIFNCNMPSEAIYQGLKSEIVINHDIVNGLLNGAMTWNNNASDKSSTAANKAVYAFPTDSYQRRIIRTIQDKRALVAVGPAGNGKSQTIANVIAEHIADGKKVLFVAEKPSARTVVYNKLKQLKLDAFCLSVSGDTQSIKEVKDKLSYTLKFISNYTPGGNYDALTEYETCVEKFRKYHDELTKKRSCGKSLIKLYEEAELYKDINQTLELGSLKTNVSANDSEAIVAAYADLLKNNPEFNIHSLRYMKQIDTCEAEIEEGEKAINKASFAYEAFEKEAWQLAGKFGVANRSSEEVAEQGLRYAKVLDRCPVVGTGIPDIDEDVLLEIIRLTRDITTFPSGSVKYKEANTRLTELLSDADKEVNEGFNGLAFDAVGMRFIGGVRPGRPNGGFSKEEIEYIQNFKRYKQYEKRLFEISVGRPEAERKTLLKLARTIARGDGADIKKSADDIIKAHCNYKNALEDAANRLLKDYDGENVRKLLDEWHRYSMSPEKMCEYLNVVKSADDTGILSVLYQLDDKIRNNYITPEQAVPLFRKSKNRILIGELLRESPEISDYNKLKYRFHVMQLQSKETAAREAYRKQVLDFIVSTMPDVSEGVQNNPGMGAIQRFIRGGNTGKSVRRLFEQGETALMQLYPCMIMSPNAVAEILPEDIPEYDLVIFDESSQLQSYKALIPIAHAEKCMIVGDEKQLVPTSFFEKNVFDENGMVVTTESILEDAIATSMPQLMLNYHYRSKYESLISFSNARYYDGEMNTFPNPDISFEGVDHVFVDSGVYDRGGKRTNEAEAKKVIEIVNEIYEKLPEDTEETVGIITFGIEQMKLIQEMIRVAVREKTACCKQLDRLVDVVNLESCQGREWDTTVLSMTYGKDANGDLPRNFGPLERDEGRNRLNVMITRAKKRMIVVTSMQPEDFSDNVKAGVADIRDFLSYAKGELRLDTRETGSEPEQIPADMCENLAEMLRKKGYVVHTNIGSSACKVDLAIVSNAENKDRYQLGILLDDFNGRFDVVDRETVIADALKNKGWKLYRVHSAEWNRNPEKEIEQIEALLLQEA